MDEPFVDGGGFHFDLGALGGQLALQVLAHLEGVGDLLLQVLFDRGERVGADVFHLVGQLAEADGAEVDAAVTVNVFGAKVKQITVTTAANARCRCEVSAGHTGEITHHSSKL